KSTTRHPIRIVVSSKGEIPLNAKVITHRPDIPTLIATTTQCSFKQRNDLEKKGCRVIESGNGPLTDLPQLLNILKKDYNIKKLMLEGGSRLNGSMLQNKLIDEVQLAIAPVICGNEGVPLFTLPQSISTFNESPFFEVASYDKIDDMIWLRLSVHYHSRRIT
ncbi:MAG: RibD family protein, partial [Candidatus Heimdallarchaeota archaeon]